MVGCGGAKGTVTGKVYYKDKIVPSGLVVFLSETNHAVRSQIQEDGSYTIEDMPVGPVTIGVIQGLVYTGKKDGNMSQLGIEGAEPREIAPTQLVPIPLKYANPKDSGVKYTVQPGNQEHDIRLPD
jgi:hypothetical protein